MRKLNYLPRKTLRHYGGLPLTKSPNRRIFGFGFRLRPNSEPLARNFRYALAVVRNSVKVETNSTFEEVR